MTEGAWSNCILLEASDGKAEALQTVVTRFTLCFRESSGCLQFDCFQSLENPSRFMLQVQFGDRASLDKHLSSEELRGFFEQIMAFSLSSSIEAEYQSFAQISGA